MMGQSETIGNRTRSEAMGVQVKNIVSRRGKTTLRGGGKGKKSAKHIRVGVKGFDLVKKCSQPKSWKVEMNQHVY